VFPSKTVYSYTSSEIQSTSCSSAIRANSRTSSSEETAPVGFPGEFTTNATVSSVIAASIAAGSIVRSSSRRDRDRFAPGQLRQRVVGDEPRVRNQHLVTGVDVRL